MSERLFDGFDAVSAEEWREKIIKDLKGKPFESLQKENFEGIKIKPDYTLDDMAPNTGIPGEAPYARGSKTENNSWSINQTFRCTDEKSTNAHLLDSLNRGATSITLEINSSPIDFAIVLHEILPQYIESHLSTDRDWEKHQEAFRQWVAKQNIAEATVKGGILYDPIGHLLTTGNWYVSEEEDLKMVETLFQQKISSSHWKTTAVNGHHFHNAGASATQELGYALAQAHEYLVKLMECGATVEEAASSIWFSLAAGTNYFMDMAKLRAARTLWSKIVAEYVSGNEQPPLYLHVQTSNWFNTIYDPYNNMLRATTESMSAIIGGCDSLTVLPFDTAYKASDEFSQRIARNVQLILQEESYMDKIVDPAAGSYYIEYLTDQVAQKAWEVFQEVEQKGGLLAALKEGIVQQSIKEMASRKAEKVENGELVILGVNTYPNAQEKMKDKVATHQVVSDASTSTAITPIHLHRAAAKMEEERLAGE